MSLTLCGYSEKQKETRVLTVTVGAAKSPSCPTTRLPAVDDLTFPYIKAILSQAFLLLVIVVLQSLGDQSSDCLRRGLVRGLAAWTGLWPFAPGQAGPVLQVWDSSWDCLTLSRFWTPIL